MDIQADVPDCVVLRGANLGGAMLAGASLREADLLDSILGAAVLDDADATGAIFDRCSITRTEFYDTGLCGARFRENVFVTTEIVNADLRGAALDDCEFVRASLDNVRVHGARFNGCHGVLMDYSMDVGKDDPELLSGDALLPWLLSAGAGHIEPDELHFSTSASS